MMDKEDKELSNASDEDFTNLDSSSDSSDEVKDDNDSDHDSDDSNQDGSRKKKKKNQKKPTKKAKKVPKQKIIFNVSDTQYDVVKYVGKKIFKWKLSYEKESMDWDMFWTDCAVQPETLARMQTYQKINHFPGMYSLARKNHLGRNLMRMKKNFPEHYKFFPSTYLLPSEYAEFRAQFSKKNTKTFIVKPEASCQGRGIFLTMSPDSVQMGEHYVVQRYLQKPFLIDGLKFDMRIYVLIAGCDPLKVFLFDDGLGRFATENYVAPNADNLDNLCMHLTNYAINKENPNFVFNESSGADDVGHKRSLKAVFRTLRELGHDVDKLWKEIKKIIIKTFCSVQPILAHSYRSCHPDEPYNNMCFELLGFDVMIDHKLRPWLIEVNHTPSFTTDTPLDKSIKKSAIRDALKIMNISVENNIKAKNKKRMELQQRVLTGKKVKMTPEEKKEAFEKAQQERDQWESKNLGRYEKIYPFDDPTQADEDYEEFMKVANKSWEEWTGLSIKRNTKKVADPNKPPPMVFGNGPAAAPLPKVAKQKTMAPAQAQNLNQNAKLPQANVEGDEAYGIERRLDDENTAFMAQMAAITGKERCDVVAEDHEEGDTERNMRPEVKSYTMVMSGVHNRADERQNTGNGEIDVNYKIMNNSSPSMNGVSSSPESKVTSKNAAFRIKTLASVKDSPLRSLNEPASDEKYALAKKFANYLNADKVEEMQMAVGVGKDLYPKKVPLKLSNGIVGDFGSAGIHQIWAGPGSLAEAYAQEAERGPREASNLLLNKMSSGRNEYNLKAYGKKMSSPSYQHQHQNSKPGNYIAPKLFELNINGGGNSNAKEEVPVKPQVNGGPKEISLQGFGVVTKGPGKGVVVQRGSSQNLNPVFESQQAAIQRYYNYLNQYKK